MRFLFNAVLFVVWLGAIAGGSCLAFRYAWSPAATHEAGACWPPCRELSRDSRRPTLVMFVHPKCPCTRASLAELTAILTRCGGRFRAEMVFVRPPGVDAGWEQTDLWQVARDLPDVEVVVDSSGDIVRTFDAQVSGETYLYDGRGRRLFHGGITASRGHEGENAGAYAVIEFIERGFSDRDQYAVYGCALLDQ